MSKGVIVCSLLLTVGVIPTVMAEEVVQAENDKKMELKTTSPHHLTHTVGILSDYLFRGLSFAKRGAFQTSIDYNHDNGLYAGFAYGTVHKDSVFGATYETDYYVGYRKAFTDDFAITGEIFNFTFPQGYEIKDGNGLNGQNADVVEAILKVDYKGFNFKYFHSLTNWFGWNTKSLSYLTDSNGNSIGDGSTKGSHYFDFNYTGKLPTTDANYHLHIGRQVVNNYSVYDYTDMSVGISRSFEFAGSKGWTAAMSYIHLITNKGWYIDAAGDDLDESRFYGYVKHTHNFF